MKPETFRRRGWILVLVGVLFLVWSLLASLYSWQISDGFGASQGNLWAMTFWVQMTIVGATLVLVGTVVVVLGYAADYFKR